MRLTTCWLLLLVSAPAIEAQTLPRRLSELPAQAATWPPAWAGLVRAVVPVGDKIVDHFEDEVLTRLAAVMAAEPESSERFRLADIVLSATLRHHLSVRQSDANVDERWLVVQKKLHGELTRVRQDWLEHLRKKDDIQSALALADRWQPTASKGDPLGESILKLWSEQAKTALDKSDYAAARGWVYRMENAFDTIPQSLATALRERAQALLKESQPMPDAAAIKTLQGALTLWPRLPAARDTLARRQGTFKTLTVGVRSLPEYLSPALASSESEKQSLALLFDRLYQVEVHRGVGKRYLPVLAGTLTENALIRSIPLRREAYFSSGERVTVADVRHTALLMNQSDAAGRTALWRDFLEPPQLAGQPFEVNVKYRQGLFDPLSPLTFWVLPRDYRGKELRHADDAEFAKSPVGSGPFQYVGRKVDGDRTISVFQANPNDLRGGSAVREIRMTAWNDARKDLPKPLPQLMVDAPTDQLAALKELGYLEADTGPSTSVDFLAINHRKPSLIPIAVRRAIAAAIDRQSILDRHFRSATKYHRTANGLFPRQSWANAPAPTVPEEIFNVEHARTFAKSLGKNAGPFVWSLKYPAGDAHVKAACEDMARAIAQVFADAKIKAEVRLQGQLWPDLRRAIQERDYDLLYTSADSLDDPVRLALMFDRQEDAIRAGGSNYLGYDNDAKLTELLTATLKHRQFAAVQKNMQALHLHLYETMPVIPLWQLDVHVLTQPSLIAAIHGREVFAKVREWKLP